MSVATANMVLAGRSRSRAWRIAATSGAMAEPQAAVAMKQPDSLVNVGVVVVNVTVTSGEVCPQVSSARTPTVYSVAGFNDDSVKEAGVPGIPGMTSGAVGAELKSSSVIEAPTRYRMS